MSRTARRLSNGRSCGGLSRSITKACLTRRVHFIRCSALSIRIWWPSCLIRPVRACINAATAAMRMKRRSKRRSPPGSSIWRGCAGIRWSMIRCVVQVHWWSKRRWRRWTSRRASAAGSPRRTGGVFRMAPSSGNGGKQLRRCGGMLHFWLTLRTTIRNRFVWRRRTPSKPG